MSEKSLLNRRAASEYLNAKGLKTAPATLAKYACVGGGPAFKKWGRQPVYDPIELDRWAEERLIIAPDSGRA
jgi:hypothetical protein